jgi:Fe-S-cluster containining protein
MDGKAMGFLQKEAGKAVTDCFATGLTAENLINCAVVQIQFYQAMQDSLMEAQPPAQPIACTSKCDFCCHQKVAATIPEAFGIAAWLSEKPDAEQQRVRAASRLLHDTTAELDDFGRVRSGLPCPLLVDGDCSTYEIRPLACRAAYSFSRPACESFYRDFQFETPIPHYDLTMQAEGQMLLGYSRALEKLGLDGGLVELSSALLIVLEQPDAVTRYLAGERLFDSAKIGRYRKPG